MQVQLIHRSMKLTNGLSDSSCLAGSSTMCPGSKFRSCSCSLMCIFGHLCVRETVGVYSPKRTSNWAPGSSIHNFVLNCHEMLFLLFGEHIRACFDVLGF